MGLCSEDSFWTFFFFLLMHTRHTVAGIYGGRVQMVCVAAVGSLEVQSDG